MDFNDTFHVCPSYFFADELFRVMISHTSTIVTWPTCRPLVLFSCDIVLGYGHRHSHLHKKSPTAVSVRARKLKFGIILK